MLKAIHRFVSFFKKIRLKFFRNESAFLVGCLLAVGVAGCGGSDGESLKSADMVLKNGEIHTMDAGRSKVEAVAIRNGKIEFVGDNKGAEKFIGSGTSVIDLDGRMVVPGFVDGHNHVSDHPESMFWLTTRSYPSVSEIGEAIKKYRQEHPELKQLRAIGWSVDVLKKAATDSGKSPAELLDDYVNDIPVVVLHDWHHDMWVNTKALVNAGVDKNTPDPLGAFIERVPGTDADGYGVPNGVMREFGAMKLIEQALPFPEFTKEEFRAAILSWQKMAAERGVTSVLVPQPRPTANFYEALLELDQENLLTVFYDVGIWANETRGVEQIPELVTIRDKYKDKGKKFKIDTIKIFATGSYAWAPSDALVWNQESLKETVAALDKEGFRIFVHDEGDLDSYNSVLDAFEYAISANGRRDARHTITHVSNKAIGAIDRFKSLGVRADSHPVPKEFFDAGVKVSFSSDYPVVDFFPQTRLAIAMRRGYDVIDAIAAHTIMGSELLFAEDSIGSLEVGKSGDLVVFDESLSKMDYLEVLSARAVMTVAGGKVVFDTLGK